ncbi:hypothetical protein [Streptacidiphilus sp. MAP5-52]|uniref:hypothetical protein n=1 Tax=Streptacidiphilus sp. MAP5-52 TaxID=3156267 RepID=UPI00351828EF
MPRPDQQPTLTGQVQDATARAGRALAQLRELSADLTPAEAAEVLQELLLVPGPAHQLAQVLTVIGQRVAVEHADTPALWEPLLEAAGHITVAHLRAANAATALADAEDARHLRRTTAATASSPALQAAGPGARIHHSPAPAPHPRIAEPPHR